jgi:predicted MFS family arabinose efflux permease
MTYHPSPRIDQAGVASAPAPAPKFTVGEEFRAGWHTILVAAIGVCAGVTGLPFYTIGLLIRPLTAGFGWSRAGVSGAALFLQLGIVFSAPLIGGLVDRIGLHRVALASLLALAAAFAALPLLGSSLIAFYAAWLLLSLAGSGTTPLVWTRAVIGRFSAARGLALGLTLLGTGIAGIIAPAVIGHVIVTHGWRTGSLALAALIACAWPIVFALLAEPPRVASFAATAPRVALTELMREQRLVRIVVAFLLLGLGVTALIVHLVPVLAERGYSEGEAVGAAAVLGLAVMAGRVIVGSLVDRFHAPFVAFAFLMLPVVACAWLFVGAPAIVAVLLLGLAAGAEIDLLAYFVSRYFPLARYGATYGWALSVFSLGAGFGPVLGGALFDATQDYATMLIAAASVIAIAATMIATLGRTHSSPPGQF